MNEPTVLDYVKAKLKFWEKTDLHLPHPTEEPQVLPPSPARTRTAGGASSSAVDDTSLPAAGMQPAAVVQPAAESLQPALAREAVRFPWLALLPVLSALAAQLFIEPPARFGAIAGLVYVGTAVLTTLAFLRGALRPAEHEVVEPAQDSLELRWLLAALAIPFALLAFLFFANNRFTFLNVTLWAVSLGLFLLAFLQHERLPDLPGAARRVGQFLRWPGQELNIRVTRWTVLLVAVLALLAFFRFYRLDTLPIDMVSDHAEKLLDVNDVMNGIPSIFFERNTGREPLQFYWTALVIKLFNLDVSFYSLKLGTVLTGLVVLFYTYRLGKLVGNRWVALFALLFVGVAYWPNVISRIALRFPFYPFFVAPLLFHLIRALRMGTRNDFVWAGIWLGIGLNGYTSSRIVPFLVVIAFVLYLLHIRSGESRGQALFGLILIVFMSLLVCLPLIRYMLDHPDMVMYRINTRLSTAERDLPGSPLELFIDNFWKAITMFFYDNGSIWPHSIPYRPALDVVMAGLFFVGVVLLLARYIQKRDWEDLFLVVSIPVLLLPSALSLAFPGENPALNRTAGAYVPVLLIAAIALEALLRGLAQRLPRRSGQAFAALIGLVLLTWTVANNYNLFFVQYADNYRLNAWNTREIGYVARDFAKLTGTHETYYVMGFPHWIDSRQVGIFAGNIDRDPALLPGSIPDTIPDPRMKMFILKPEDTQTLETLSQIYPEGQAEFRKSEQINKDFVLFLVPAKTGQLP